MPLEIAVIKWCEGDNLTSENDSSGGKKVQEEPANSEKESSEKKLKNADREKNITKNVLSEEKGGAKVAEDLDGKDGETLQEKRGESDKLVVRETEDGMESFGSQDVTISASGNGNSAGDPASILTNSISKEAWNKVLLMIRPGHASTEALLRAARPLEFNGTTLKIGVYYKFHKEHLEEAHHRDVLEKALENYLGSTVRVICSLTDAPVGPVKTEPKVEDGVSDTSSDVVLTEPDRTDIKVKPS